MLLALQDILNADELATLRERVVRAEYAAGGLTAGEGSRERKHNLQIAAGDPALPELRQVVTQAFMRNQLFQFLAMPKHIMPIVFNRYDEGMYYKDHVDFPLLGTSPRMRADLSITLFLSNRDEYEGGELVIEQSSGAQAVKLDSGQAIIYPSYSIHRVTPVTRGTRFAAVTTVQSFVRDEVKRDLIADLVRLMRWVQDVAPQSDQARLANKIHANLLRIWADE
jgi:PKHD-type hydroxylase